MCVVIHNDWVDWLWTGPRPPCDVRCDPQRWTWLVMDRTDEALVSWKLWSNEIDWCCRAEHVCICMHWTRCFSLVGYLFGDREFRTWPHTRLYVLRSWYWDSWWAFCNISGRRGGCSVVNSSAYGPETRLPIPFVNLCFGLIRRIFPLSIESRALLCSLILYLLRLHTLDYRSVDRC